MKRLLLLLGLLVAGDVSSQISGGSLSGGCLPLGTTSIPGCLQPDGTTITVVGGVITASAGAATSVPFSGVTAATNANALVVGTGGSLGTSGTGTITATSAAGAIAATTLSASSTVSGAGFSTYLASPPAIGGSTPAAGSFVALSSTGLFSPTLGITATGAAINLNASSNFATSINTGTSNGAIGIGNNTSTSGAQITTFSGADLFSYGTNFSAATWGQTSPLWATSAMTMNDSAASGTSTNDTGYTFGAVNFTATGGASVTITNANGVFFNAPTCTTVVCTNIYAINSGGAIKGSLGETINGAIINLNAASNFATNINTGSSNAAVGIGSGSGNNIITIGNGTGTVLFKGPVISAAGTQFTVASGTGACATSSTLHGGVQVGDFKCTGSTGASTATLTLVATTTSYSCSGRDITTPTTVTQTGAVSTTSVTLTFTSVAANDVVQFNCWGY